MTLFKTYKIGDAREDIESSDTGVTDIDALTEDDHEQGIDESIEDQSEIAQISVDIIETGMELVILAPLSGSKLEDIDIKLKQGSLIISGERQIPFEYGEYTALVSEMYWGEFSRKIILPTDVDYTKIEAKSDDGMLIVRIPKFSDNMEQKISITEIE